MTIKEALLKYAATQNFGALRTLCNRLFPQAREAIEKGMMSGKLSSELNAEGAQITTPTNVIDFTFEDGCVWAHLSNSK